MGKAIALTEEMRDQLVMRRRQGHSWRELARHFGVSPSTIGRWIVRDEVAGFLESHHCRIDPQPLVGFYMGFAVDDYAKLSRYTEVGAYRLKSGEQVRIQDFNLENGTAQCERLRSWAARGMAVDRHPLHAGLPIGAPSIDIPIKALTLDYRFVKGDHAFLDGDCVQIKQVFSERNSVLLGDGSGGKEIPIAMLCASRWDEYKVKARSFLESGHEKAGLGDYEGAWQDFSHATSLYPGSIEAHISAGIASTKLHGEGVGIRDYRAAISLCPDDAATYFETYAANYRHTPIQKQDFEIAACYNRCLPEYMQFRPEDAKPIFEAALRRAEQEGNQRLKGHIEEWIRELFPREHV